MLVDNDKTIMMFTLEVKILLETIDGSKVTVSAYILLIHLLENSLPHPPWNFSQIQKKFRTLQILVSNLKIFSYFCNFLQKFCETSGWKPAPEADYV